MSNYHSWRFCVAPMMGYTDVYFRHLFRFISAHARLYTEMVHVEEFCRFPTRRLPIAEPVGPVALQLGGACPKRLAEAAVIAQEMGCYAEINLNVGCPSPKVQHGQFGACLFLEPQRVADCVASMRQVCSLPITIKTRLGVDDKDEWSDLMHFMDCTRQAGCQIFILHARKAWLKGLNPKQNREIPPLRYDWVYRVKQTFPQCQIVLNGGILTLEEGLTHLENADGIMVGRAAYNPWAQWRALDHLMFSTPPTEWSTQISRMQEWVRSLDIPTRHLQRHFLTLLKATPDVRRWRRNLSENADILEKTLSYLEYAKNVFE